MSLPATAHVASDASLAPDVQVGPNVVVEPGVEVGPGTVLEAGAVLRTGTRVGARCRIGPYAVLGGDPMDRNFRGEETSVVIEEGVTIREFATVHRATGAGGETRIGAGALLMCYVHVGHNGSVGPGCVLTNGVQLGGHAVVGERAVLGAAAMVHQFARVGAFAMVGGGSTVSNDVLPYALAQGNPARHFRVNRVGLERNGFSADRMRTIGDALRHLRRKERDAFERLADGDDDVAAMRSFLASSSRGVARFVGTS